MASPVSTKYNCIVFLSNSIIFKIKSIVGEVLRVRGGVVGEVLRVRGGGSLGEVLRIQGGGVVGEVLHEFEGG